jgi:nucleotide-binding universal stress UspA family protein
MFRTVLVHVDAVKGSDARTRAALDLARQYGASLIGITAELPRLPADVYASALGTVAVGPEYTEFDRQELEAEFGKAAEAFKKATAGSGIETSWRAEFATPSTAIADAAAAADIIVAGAGERSLLADAGSAPAGDVALRIGRPVLIIPKDQDRIDVQNVVVAWKDTPEAQRAVADALPFMKRAKSVIVVQVREGEDEPDFKNVIAYLKGHGIAAKSQVIEAAGKSATDAIVDLARRSQTDLIVAGAYGHSRLREWAFGGVTRGLLADTPVACLLSH